jgi:hypothetical protein
MIDLFWGTVIDTIFPLPQSLTNPQKQNQKERRARNEKERVERIAALSNKKEDLSEYVEACSKLMGREETRRQSVDTRLTSIMGLCSIAGTVVFSGILALANGTLHVRIPLLRWIIALGALYLTAQLCSAILAAVCGLSRKGYPELTATDMLPATTEVSVVHLRRLMNTSLEILEKHQELNNEKVTQMALAHRAMKNFLWGLLAFAALGAFLGITATPPQDGLVDTLRKNHELHELLRGPQGPSGPAGDRGKKGLRGPQGKSCACPTSPASNAVPNGKTNILFLRDNCLCPN